MKHYVDILEPRRKECSNFMWASRELNVTLPSRKNTRPSPEKHKLDVLNNRKLKQIIQKISKEQNVSVQEVEERVRVILDEIGYNKQLTTIRWLGIFLAKVCSKVCSSINVNEDGLKRLKSSMGNTPVIYVPSHRSYADFILMSYLLFTYDIEIPAIAAGMDFHGMLGMGTVLRNTGAFFMRRIYNNDSLYWDTFKEYVYELVVNGDSGIEFFIEGTRSRSCKALPPKYGLLFMIMKAFVLGEVPDIHFVPISISYDRVMEEKLFAFELLGVPKPKETTSGFFKSLSIINESFGKIYMSFGEPISVKEYFAGKLSRIDHIMAPLPTQELVHGEKAEITKMASHILFTQQKLSIITTFNLAAIVLNNALSNRQSIMRFDELVEEVMWLNHIVEKLGAHTDLEYPRRDVFDSLKVHANLVNVDDDLNVTLRHDSIVLGDYKASSLKGHPLSEATMSTGVPFVMLQIYVNPVLHYIIPCSILVMCVKHRSDDVLKDDLFREFDYLSSILRNDFYGVYNNVQNNFDTALQNVIDFQVISTNNNNFVLGPNTKLQTLLLNLLKPFLFTYYQVCLTLQYVDGNSLKEKLIFAQTQERIEGLINKRAQQFIHPYSLSLDTISQCLLTLVNLSVLNKQRTNDCTVYVINKKDVDDVALRIGKYVGDKEMLGVQFKNKL